MGSLVLGILGFGFLCFGVGFAVVPEGMGAFVGLEMPTPAARADVRAIYGGLEVGVGAFLLACARRREWLLPGLVAAGYAFGFVAACRLGGVMRDGATDALTLGAFAVEVGAAALAAYAYRSERVAAV